MNFDVVMPLTLFVVTLVSVFLNGKAEGKLKSIMEEKEFALRDTILLVAGMAVVVSLLVLVPSMAIMILFLFSYSMLLFIFTNLFVGKRWYMAAVPPAVFIALYLLLNGTTVWDVYLVNVYGVIFAVLITLYLSSLFSWKTAVVFAALLTAVDIILVLVTGAMVSAAAKTESLKLPVLITLPTFPPTLNIKGEVLNMMLGLGDFFFAGLLGIQTLKKLGRNLAVLSVATMAVSFFAFEAYLLTMGPQAFPGTLMIITGWLPWLALIIATGKAKQKEPVSAQILGNVTEK